MRKIYSIWIILILASQVFSQSVPLLRVSPNKRFLQSSDGKPFFWLGDTGWLLFAKLSREEAIDYLDDRKEKGFNVIQVMGLHTLKIQNFYGDSALIGGNITQPKLTMGNSFDKDDEYDYWDHVDFIIDQAALRGIYIGFVLVWGDNVKKYKITPEQVQIYTRFLAKHYASKPNILWLNGGDLRGSEALDVWQTIGQTLRQYDTKHLITYHPRGRTSSSDWFNHQSWLDFNMVQSGHKSYEQDTLFIEKRHFGEDNWRYINDDYARKPSKPVIDAEPSYEGIPHGLHDTLQPRWTDADVRRYAYWSVFAGAFGFTYGHNAVIQMFKNGKNEPSSYGPLEDWRTALNAKGAGQMVFLRRLLESDAAYFKRKPAQYLVVNQGNKYDYIAVCQSPNTIYAYTYTGRNIDLNLSVIKAKKVKAHWYNPRNGEKILIPDVTKTNTISFDPPDEPKNGNDWVLILEMVR